MVPACPSIGACQKQWGTVCVCSPGSSGVQEETSCPASSDAGRIGKDADGGRQSNCGAAHDYRLQQNRCVVLPPFHLPRHVRFRHDTRRVERVETSVPSRAVRQARQPKCMGSTHSTCRASRARRVEPCCSTSSAQPKCMG